LYHIKVDIHYSRINSELEFVQLIVQFLTGSGNICFIGEKLGRNISEIRIL